MYVPKHIDTRVRDKLVADLADRGISFTELPDDLFNFRMRDILEWLKSHYALTYCYRCQRLTEPDEMAGRGNTCNKHVKSRYRMNHKYVPPREIVELFQSKRASNVRTSHDSEMRKAWREAQTLTETEKEEINERFDKSTGGLDLDKFRNLHHGKKD